MSVLNAISFPREWTRMHLGAVTTRVVEPGFGTLEPLSVFLGEGVIPRAQRDDNHNQLGADLEKYQRVLPGDLVFNKLRTWQGGFGVSRYTGIVSPAYIIARPTRDVDPQFLHHLMRSDPVLAELARLSKWMPPSQFDIAWEDIRSIEIALPPIEEQRRIADFLDDQVSRIGELEALRSQQTQLLNELMASELDRHVTGPLAVLGRTLDLLRDGTHGSFQRVGNGVPLLSVRNMQQGNLLVLDDDSRVSPADAHHIWKGCPVRRGDVLLAIVGATLGKVAAYEFDEPYPLQRSVAVLRPRPRFTSSEWLLAALSTPQVQSQLWRYVGFSAQPGVYLGTVASLRIPLPPPEEQRRILEKIANVTAAISSIRRALREALRSLAEYKRSLITAAVTGELDVTTARRGIPA